MKRMYFGIGLLAVLLAVGIGLTALFVSLHSPLSDTLEHAGNAAGDGDWETAQALLERASAAWNRGRYFTAAVADHGPIEEMEATFYRLKVLAKLRQADEFTADCVQLARMAEAMADSQRLTWWNLL